MSLAYQNAILADLPALYARLDMVGPATDGDVIPDISGNGLDLELEYAPTPFSGGTPPSPEPYGYASPIETDASSKELFCWANTGGLGGFSGTSMAKRAVTGSLQPTGDFACEAWIRPQSGMYSAVLIRLVGTNDVGLGWTVASGGQRFCAYVTDSAGTVWAAADLSFEFVSYIGQSFYLCAVRSGNSLTLYINGYPRKTITISSGLANRTSGGLFFIGHNSSLHFHKERIDEVAFYDHDLSSSEVLIHYEAALNRIPIRGIVTVPVTITLNTDAVVPLDFPFVHNFAGATSGVEQPLIERLRYSTDVLQSFADFEQRINENPYGVARSLVYDLTSSSANERSRILNRLWLPGQTYIIPIRSDWTVVTAEATAGASEIECDTVGRDFDVGSRVILMPDENPLSLTNHEVKRITAVNAGSVEILGVLANTWPVGSLIAPYRRALINESSLPLKSYTTSKQSLQVEFDILRDEISTNRITPFTPALTHKGLEVFQLEKAQVDWLDEIDADITRRAQTHEPRFGRKYSRNQDSGSPRTFPVRLLFTTREGISGFFGWLDARQGKAQPLWIPSNEHDFTKIARDVTGALITVEDVGYKEFINQHQARRDIVFIQTDGSLVCRRITGSVNNGDGTETLTITGSITIGQFNATERISYLHCCRLLSNDIELAWHRNLSGNEGDMILEATVTFLDLLTSPA